MSKNFEMKVMNKAKVLRMNSLGERFVHITHCDDADGIGCELIDKYLDCDVTVYRSHINDMIDIITNENSALYTGNPLVVITDIGVTLPVIEKLEELKFNFIWIDHHMVDDETAERIKDDERFFVYNEKYNIRSMPRYVMDSVYMKDDCMKVSAAFLYLYFMQDILKDDVNLSRLAEIITYVSLGDTYEMKNVKETAFKAALVLDNINDWIPGESKYSICYDYPAFILKKFGPENFLATFHRYILDGDRSKIISNMKKISEFRELEYAIFEKNVNSTGYHGKMIAVSPYAFGEFSYCANRYLNNHSVDAVAEIWSQTYGGTTVYKISMRSLDPEKFNCADICREEFNGGGHPCAAGGTLTKEDFDFFIASMNPDKATNVVDSDDELY